MNRRADWERLIRALDDWTSAVQVDPGRIQVSLPDDARDARAEIVMTPEEWDDVWGVMWGNFDDAVREVKRTLLSLAPHEHFAVYEQYRLVPSAQSSLVENESSMPLPGAGGEWQVRDKDGRVTSTFSEWTDPDPRAEDETR